jgi:hypothetical protein
MRFLIDKGWLEFAEVRGVVRNSRKSTKFRTEFTIF